MKRHYYISDDLDALELVEKQLKQAGVSTPQIHVLSEDGQGVQQHHLHEVESVLKKDVVRGTELGAVVGVIGAALIIFLAWVSGLPETYTWVPAVFLAIIVLGFCTWEGGLIGIQKPHVDFQRFHEDLHQGKHVLFIDADPDQENILQRIVSAHPKLQDAGEGSSTPRWVVSLQKFWWKIDPKLRNQ
ncbi:NAD/FAD-utilizing enzyme [Halieaceae bacterium]|nr:NAD/FAD-utilizing enzyme [Halieaceae bacterium]